MPTTATCLLETRIEGVPLFRRGKVRDVYDIGDKLLIVATDRLSAFDVILPTGIPGKGVLLTQISLFWFRLLADVAPNHILTSDVAQYPAELQRFSDQLEGRSMLVTKTDVLPVECVVRGYLAGSGWRDYRASGSICGISLPSGLREADRLEKPIFTPATKADVGHDENIDFSKAVAIVGLSRAKQLRDTSIALYKRARAFAQERGILLADTKFEFGVRDDQLIWVDEAITPDSSRFWPAAGYEPGQSQVSFDKQFVRDYLERLTWNKRPPGPELPPDIVAKTREKYVEAFTRLTGKSSP
jgi:phosphoribosylaminoimidazole-succinocarboxamide synthase